MVTVRRCALLLLLLVVPACHVGAGPVVAYSVKNGLRWGVEAEAGYYLVAGLIGAASPGTRSGGWERYAVAADFAPFAQTNRVGVGPGLSLGGSGGSEGLHFTASGWGMGFAAYCGSTNCQDGNEPILLFVALVGVRYLGGTLELYAAPKVIGFP